MTADRVPSGRTALVTGAGSGIGAALARHLAQDGARVVVTDIDEASAQAVAADISRDGGEAIARRLDVTDDASWTDTRDFAETRFGPIDILCSNAGAVGTTRPVAEIEPDAFRWLFETNVVSALHAIRAIGPGMIARRRGWMLFTGSTSALSALPGYGDYCASKHALLALVEAFAKETRDSGMHVSVFCPASVTTDLTATTRRHLPPGLAQSFASGHPRTRATRADAIAAAGGAISPDIAARHALHGLAAGEFLIFSHAQTEARLGERGEAIAAGFAALRDRETGASNH